MDDRALLEAAAKAAGYTLEKTLPGYPLWVKGVGIWNPLDNSWDAMNLAVALRMKFDFSSSAAWVELPQGEEAPRFFGDDPSAAARRAIVMAGAELAPKD